MCFVTVYLFLFTESYSNNQQQSLVPLYHYQPWIYDSIRISSDINVNTQVCGFLIHITYHSSSPACTTTSA